LLAAVLGIWGTIGFKMVNGLSPDLPEKRMQTFDVAFNPKTQTQTDTFSIKMIQRDPFLGTLTYKKNNSTATVKKTIKANTKTNQPKISYSGLIKKQSTSDQVFVVTIGNKQHLLKQGQIADSVRLVRGNSKEISVKYKNKYLTIKRQ